MTMSVHHFTTALQDCVSQSVWHKLPFRFLLILRKNRLNEMVTQLPVPVHPLADRVFSFNSFVHHV